MQRSIYAFVHGDVLAAIKYNLFFVLSIPYALLAVLVSWYNFNHVFDTLKAKLFQGRVLRIYVVLYFMWWVVRNILCV